MKRKSPPPIPHVLTVVNFLSLNRPTNRGQRRGEREGRAVPHFVPWRKKGGQISFILGGEGREGGGKEIVWHLESQNLAPFLPQAVKGIFASRDGERKGRLVVL